ncbi:hypothetical protein [Embleya scabrispora]|nr:hypothetical protein [Embleya scabrispora]
MSDQHQHDDGPGEPAADAERFETVWDRTANGGVGGWVRRRVTAGPTAVNPGAPPRPHHEPTAHLPAATPPARPGTPPHTPSASPDEQDTVDNPAAARGMPAGPPPPGWPVSAPPPVSTPPRVSPQPPAVTPPSVPAPPSRPPVSPDSSAPTADWYRQDPGHTPVHGVPPARDVPVAPDWYRGATPPAPGPLSPTPPGPSFERTLLFIVAAVVLVAAVGTLFALKPWAEDDKKPAAHGSPSVESTAGSPSSSGDAAGAPPGAPSTPPPAGQTTITTTPPPASPTPDGRGQAAALDTLLSRSGSSRQSVIDAVNNVGSCSSPAASRSALLDAAAQRDQLVTQLDAMRFDGVPELQAAVPTLRTAWTASARADRSFAAWAQSAADSGCPGTRALYDEGAAISSEASTAKKSFVTTWNAVASRYGLTSRSELDL